MPVTNGLLENCAGSSGDLSGGGSSSLGPETSGGSVSALSRIFSTVAATASTPSARSRTAQSWILRPSRKISVSSVSGFSGTGRIRSMDTRAMRIGTAVGIASPAHTTSEAGAEPCCMVGSQGPAAWGLTVTRLPSTRKMDSIKSNELVLPWRGRVGPHRAKRDKDRGGVTVYPFIQRPSGEITHPGSYFASLM